jgi:hypothetical protein
MTRLEKALQKLGYTKATYGYEHIRDMLLKNDCPGDYLEGEPIGDEKTQVYEGNIAIMCRGIRCEDCWNHDVEKET